MGVSNLTGTITTHTQSQSHMTELGEELLSYHRDEDYKIIRLRDDLISAVRYAFMERYKGKLLDGCEPHGRAPGIAGAYDPRPVRLVAPQPTQFARGSANHPDGELTFSPHGPHKRVLRKLS